MKLDDKLIATYFPPRKRELHKGECGTAAIVAGTSSAGAGVLAARACLKSGAGYTKFYVEGDTLPYVLCMPACIVRGMEEEELKKADAIAVGMGAGVSGALYELLRRLLCGYRGTLVLDADALNTLARYGEEILIKKTCDVVVTPHIKEFSRLTGLSVERILQDPAAHAEAFAKKYGVVVALKSHETVTTDGTRTAFNPTGSPCQAKGGSGDALAGFLAGSAARGLAPFDAAVAASYICGRAGELAAREQGEYSPDATDIISFLGKAILSLGG